MMMTEDKCIQITEIYYSSWYKKKKIQKFKQNVYPCSVFKINLNYNLQKNLLSLAESAEY